MKSAIRFDPTTAHKPLKTSALIVTDVACLAAGSAWALTRWASREAVGYARKCHWL